MDDGADVSLAGRVLSERYRLDELIATGGMGVVYRGEHVKLRKPVAVKLLLPHAAERKELVERFEREAVAGARVHHPHVVAARDFGRETDGSHFLVLDYVDGANLAKDIAAGPMALEAVTTTAALPPSDRKGKGHTVRMTREGSPARTGQGTVIMRGPVAKPSPSSPLVDVAARLRELPPAAWAGAGVLFVVGVLFALLATRKGRADGAPSAGRTAGVAVIAPTVAPVPTPSARQALIEVDGFDATTWRARLLGASEEEDWASGGKALLALAQIDDEALADGRRRGAAVAVASALAFAGGETADGVFAALKNAFGADGIEVLFEIVRTRGATRASARASEILASPEVAPRVPASMRLALEFRKASCEEKRGMFARMVEQGDRRALDELVILRDSKCERDSDPCCFREDKDIATAIKQLRERLKVGGGP